MAATAVSALVTVIDVLANDDGALDGSTLRVVVAPERGSAVVTAEHRIGYTPDRFWSGEDRFVYEVCEAAVEADGAARCGRAEVSITSEFVIEALQFEVAATAAFWDLPLGSPRRADTATFPYVDTGEVTRQPDGTWRWRLVPPGPVSFPAVAVVHVDNEDGTRSELRITLVGAPPAPPVPPVVVDVTATATSAQPTVIDVLANDTGPDVPLDPATLTIVEAPLHGTASVTTQHTIEYTPERFWPGEDRLVYEVCDEVGVCDQAEVSITSALQIEEFVFPIASNATFWTFEFAAHRVEETAEFVHVDAGEVRQLGNGLWRWQFTVGQGQFDLPLRMVVNVDSVDGSRSEVRVTLVADDGAGIS